VLVDRQRLPASMAGDELKLRHESIDTTLSYYVGRNAERTAAILWSEDRETSSSADKSETAAEPDGAKPICLLS